MKLTHGTDPLRLGADEVAQTLRARGFAAVFAGGCVRDLVLGLRPKDYDIATDATPEEVQRIFRRTVLVGAAFGVVRVVLSDRREYEVATFRTDGAYADGRRPMDVAYTRSPAEDVARRDFTINALLLDPRDDEVIDLVGGLDDLSAGVIRAVGVPEQRFFEDKLRMLRAVRFAARFGFALEAGTARAIGQHAADVRQVSVERIVHEVEATWATSRPAHGLALWGELGLWPVIFPWAQAVDVAALAPAFARLPAVAERHGLGPTERAQVGWALVLDRAAPPDVEEVLRAAKLSREHIRTIQAVLAARAVLHDAARARLAERARVVTSPLAPVLAAYAEARHGEDADTVRVLHALADDHARAPLPPMPLLTGADLKGLGLAPGPAYKAILAALEDEVLERRIDTREAALAFAASTARVWLGGSAG